MGREDKATWKSNYFLKLNQLFEEYTKCFIVGVDNVGSKQMQQIRIALRGHAVILNGKNTMIRKALRAQLDKNPNLEKLFPHIKENIGFVFTHDDLIFIRDKLLENKVAAPARAGAYAPVDVRLQPQNTGMGPEKTSFFQALQIPTKITKGTIEILSEVHLIEAGAKVGASEATLLNMLKVSPFTYGLVVRQVYDSGSCFGPEVLDITPEVIQERFQVGLQRVAALTMQVSYPNQSNASHYLINGFKNLVAVCAATEDLSFKQADTMLEILRDPTKLAALTAAAAPAASEAPKEEAKVEEEEESDDGMDFCLFGDD